MRQRSLVGPLVFGIALGICAVSARLLYRRFRSAAKAERERHEDDRLVDEAAMDSFPASDPPAFNTGTATTRRGS